ncbi:AAA family ATPase [Malaciobacter marinus]|uniref:ATP-binding protein n=1 Tax=Malaciobacter marinus TaxID=505249 RepID=A0A347TMY1_9BACT|nr:MULTISPECIES: AAA family ATPase [Malaciobacter]AXX87959.1 polar flagellar biogenesis regulatory protein FlhG [Malaciobacter marinus]PHO13259.1 ATP-binding protein [Malaciobacter marinus]PHO16012.1 ATP-binding protein [Malaciobacter marinus]RYA24784.1 MinD/ParA family protein [Malaciobacter halophilus]
MFNSISNQASRLINLTKNRQRESKTKLLTITSGKGGVGKSTFTGNIAYLLSSRGFKVAIVDADIGLANMQVLFDMKPRYTLFDYIEGKVTIDEVLLQTAYKNISLVAGKSGYQYSNHSNSFVFARIVEDIISLNEFDVVLVDTGAGLNEYVKEFLAISDNILAVTTTDPSALTDLYALIKMLSKDKEQLMLCFNHTKNHQIGNTISNSLINLAKKNRLNDNFMVKYIGNVSTSANISTTGRLRKLFSFEFKNDDSTKELQAIIDTLLKNIK